MSGGGFDAWDSYDVVPPSAGDPGSKITMPPRKKARKGKADELPEEQKVCYIEYCEQFCVGNSNACSNHKKRRDNMFNQGKKQGETALAAIKLKMSAPDTGTEEMRENEANFPDSSRFGKRQAVDWARLEREWGKRVSSIDRTKCKPYEKTQYVIEGKEKMGWNEQDCLEQWNLMEASSKIERDDKGLKGCMRLFVPKEMRLLDVEKYAQGSLKTGMRDIKVPDQAMRDGLRGHIDLCAREDDPFVKKDVCPDIDGDALDDDDAQSVLTFDNPPGEALPDTAEDRKKREAEAKKDKKSKTLEKLNGPSFMSYRAKAYQTMSDAVRKFKTAAEICDQQGREAMQLGQSSLEAWSTDDKAFRAYIDVCANRQRIARLWWMNRDGSPTTAAGPQGSRSSADGNADGAKVAETEADKSDKAKAGEEAAEKEAGEEAADEEVPDKDEEKAAADAERAKTAEKKEVEPQEKPSNLCDFVQNLPATERPVTSITTFYTHPQLAAFIERVLTMDSAVAIEAAAEEFKVISKTTEQWLKSYGKSASDIGGYLTGKTRQAQKDEEQKKKDAEKAELKVARGEAKAATKTLRNQEQLKGAIFSIEANRFLSVPEVTVASVHAQFIGSADMSKPWIIRQSPEVKAFKEAPSMVLRLSEYGGSYKKSGHGFKEEGRTQQPMAAREGKEETQALCARFLPERACVDISSLAFGSAFMQTVWMFGYSHDFVGCFPTPNSASMLKVLAHGQVKLIAFAVSELAAHFGSANMDDLAKSMLKMKAEEVADVSKISPGYATTVMAGDAIHVPAGWLVCEMSSQGALIYGVRKSWIPVSREACTQYKAVMSLLKESGRNIDKMQTVLDLMEKA